MIIISRWPSKFRRAKVGLEAVESLCSEYHLLKHEREPGTNSAQGRRHFSTYRIMKIDSIADMECISASRIIMFRLLFYMESKWMCLHSSIV
jgi:hypothetical protein